MMFLIYLLQKNDSGLLTTPIFVGICREIPAVMERKSIERYMPDLVFGPTGSFTGIIMFYCRACDDLLINDCPGNDLIW